MGGMSLANLINKKVLSCIYELLLETFPLMSVVVTSRPSASAPLHRLPCIDRFVEISGFSKEDIKEYIESEFTSDQEKASRLLVYLQVHPIAHARTDDLTGKGESIRL